LWGKTCNAFVEIVEDRRDRPAAAVAVELERRLGALLSAAAPQLTIIDMLPERLDGADDDDEGSVDSDDAGSGDEEARDAHGLIAHAPVGG
jgi:hypothetical protein